MQATQERDKIKALDEGLEAEIRSLISEQKRDQLKREEVRCCLSCSMGPRVEFALLQDLLQMEHAIIRGKSGAIIDIGLLILIHPDTVLMQSQARGTCKTVTRC